MIKASTVYDIGAAGGSIAALALILPWLYSLAVSATLPPEMPTEVAAAFSTIIVSIWRAVVVWRKPTTTSPETV